MSSGQAPLLMLDLATSQIRDRRRAVRGLASPAAARAARRTARGRGRASRAGR
ncbi:hypothetical protein [Nocardioides iriomotensis]|uniref:hypothetical protein n=1 Tax=Nocardioides iriomotensis TaxID=715784 RepID=UPI0013ED1B16|nr:hypothetical protein [Nocardioides iriomotensis]